MRSEFQFIRDIKERFSLSHIGDDCAVLPKDEVSDLLVTADLLIEDVDFRLEWAQAADLGHKSLAVSLSDIAAMGGTPTFALVSLGIPEHLWKSEFADNFYSGWHSLAEEFSVDLIGGDLSSSEKLVIDSIVLGEVSRGQAFRRSGAKPGDLIYVSGSLGGAAAGLRLLETSGESRNWDGPELEIVNRQLRPNPKLRLANQLRTSDIVTAMIDISDGLSSDLHHICEASGVGGLIDADSLPIHAGLANGSFTDEEAFDLALNGGEDFELLISISPDAEELLGALPLTQIGRITDTGKVELRSAGEVRELPAKGFRHF